MMNRTFLLSFVSLCSVALSPLATPQPDKQTKQPTPAPKFVEISPAGSANWKPSKVTVGDLAKKVSFATANLKKTLAYLTVNVQTPEGQAWFKPPSVLLRIIDSKLYRVDYVVVQSIPFSASLVRNQKERIFRLDTKVLKTSLTGKLPAAYKVTGNALVPLFETDYSRLAFQGLTEGVDAWVPVLTGMSKGVSGYKTTVEERRMKYRGQDFLSYRILATRGVSDKKPGASTFEIVLDGKRFLPVTIRNVRRDSAGKEWMSQWTSSYVFNQTIPIKDIRLGE